MNCTFKVMYVFFTNRQGNCSSWICFNGGDINMFMDLTIKLVISFFGLWAITFITGRKTLSQLTPLDFLSSLVLSEIVGNTLYDDQVKVTHLIFTLAVWTALAYLGDGRLYIIPKK
ncbi:DUF421 domain-containing protein [Paenibacillus sp. JNUCC31]|uniref:hypothetical protein n=1 Tax=Paenibacillus sp. JNUCC-31 TaxID=2777983 RepID=UPI002B21ACC8|nr:hypothetical protein [Paenibacillus sp. JNUCC-31]